jgi:hypothetical protein
MKVSTMKTTTYRLFKNQWLLAALIVSGLSVTAYTPAANASDGAAFLGGMVAGHVVGGAVRRDRQRTADMDQMAAQQAAAPAPAPAPAAPAQQSPEARIQQLDKLAAGGYITPAEYKTKKQAIIDSM